MPAKLRKSRSRNNNNRPAYKQSRKRKTPKANANGKSKPGKRSRRRVKRGGAEDIIYGIDLNDEETKKKLNNILMYCIASVLKENENEGEIKIFIPEVTSDKGKMDVVDLFLKEDVEKLLKGYLSVDTDDKNFESEVKRKVKKIKAIASRVGASEMVNEDSQTNNENIKLFRKQCNERIKKLLEEITDPVSEEAEKLWEKLGLKYDFSRRHEVINKFIKKNYKIDLKLEEKKAQFPNKIPPHNYPDYIGYDDRFDSKLCVAKVETNKGE